MKHSESTSIKATLVFYVEMLSSNFFFLLTLTCFLVCKMLQIRSCPQICSNSLECKKIQMERFLNLKDLSHASPRPSEKLTQRRLNKPSVCYIQVKWTTFLFFCFKASNTGLTLNSWLLIMQHSWRRKLILSKNEEALLWEWASSKFVWKNVRSAVGATSAPYWEVVAPPQLGKTKWQVIQIWWNCCIHT